MGLFSKRSFIWLGRNCSVVTFSWGNSSTMSGGLESLQLKEDDVVKFLAASVHVGTTNVDYQMQQYVYKKKQDGVPIINIKKTWEKLMLAARIIVSIENPADVCVISARPYGQRAVLKFASGTGATAIAGRFTPGTFTNQIQAAFREPRLLVVCDPRTDHQSVTEASYVNIPVIAFCNTDSPLKHVDVAIPCNNKGAYSIGLMWWMLAREVLRMRGTISRMHPWEVMPDLYFYRDPEDAEKEEQERLARAAEEPQPSYPAEWGGGAAPPEQGIAPVTDWSESTPAGVMEWGSENVAPAVPVQPGAFGSAAPEVTEWGAETTAPAGNIEWGAEPKEGQDNWGGGAGAEWS